MKKLINEGMNTLSAVSFLTAHSGLSDCLTSRLPDFPTSQPRTFRLSDFPTFRL